MAEQCHPDELAQLRATVMTLHARLARVEQRKSLPHRFLALTLAALFAALMPLSILAANPFTDLTGGPHDGNIDAIFNAGITKGCEPPAYVKYCPSANVTREEMASFLARTAGLGNNPPVANAQTAQTAINAQTAAQATNAVNAVNATNAQNAQNAQNAALLGGNPPGAYLPSTGDLIMRYSFYGLVQNASSDPNAAIDYFTDGVAIQATSPGTKTFHLALDQPTQIFGQDLVVKSLELCYYTFGPATSITSTRVGAARESTRGIYVINDAIPRTGGTYSTADCYTLQATPPTAHAKSMHLELIINFTDTTTLIALRSLALTLTPTPAGASAP